MKQRAAARPRPERTAAALRTALEAGALALAALSLRAIAPRALGLPLDCIAGVNAAACAVLLLAILYRRFRRAPRR